MSRDRIPFGKYKGQLVGMTVRTDPEYLNWLVNVRQMDNYPEQAQLIRQMLKSRKTVLKGRELSDFTLKRMNVVYPRIKKYWMYDLAGFLLHPHTGCPSGTFRNNRLYRFQLYGKGPHDYVYGVREKGQWFGFAEGTEEAGLAYLRSRQQPS